MYRLRGFLSPANGQRNSPNFSKGREDRQNQEVQTCWKAIGQGSVES